MRVCRHIQYIIILAKAILCISILHIMHNLLYTYWQCTTSFPVISNVMKQHRIIINEFYDARKDWVTSNLGTFLFKNSLNSDLVKNQSRNKIFNVLMWKHWPWLKRRHLEPFLKVGLDPLDDCSISNCEFFGNLDLAAADAVVVNIQKGQLPNVTKRNPSQIWIFWIDESPNHTFSLAKTKPSFSSLSNIFNWSMTYRIEADIPIPYGRTVPLPYPKLKIVDEDIIKELVPYWNSKQTDVLATILISNCFKPRLKTLMKLSRYLKLDIFGNCAVNRYNKKRYFNLSIRFRLLRVNKTSVTFDKCPGGFASECKAIDNYLFYLVMENSKCKQYITEKAFHHAYDRGAIPVIIGPPLRDCLQLLPPHSFLHVDNHKTIKDLAKEIINTSKNLTKLLSYHAWRNNFEVVNEHGYSGTRSQSLCRICEAVNYNDRSNKVYGLDDIRSFLDPKVSCTKYVVYK